MSLAVSRPEVPVRRVGFEPDPWAWTPWEYGSFTGRWDDPEDLYRVLYAASTPLGCFLEVLAVFRPDPGLAAELAEIEGDAADDAFPTVAPGQVDRAWLGRRRLGTAALAGDYVDVGHSQTIAELRPLFLARALELGLPDFDAAAIRMAAPRAVTQELSRRLYASTLSTGHTPAGIEFGSRHGDDQQLWAVFERDADVGAPRSHLLTDVRYMAIAEDHPVLLEAMALHHLAWR
ncbi:MAG: RES domain-containing protein [Acidimicrobiales bacterium]